MYVLLLILIVVAIIVIFLLRPRPHTESLWYMFGLWDDRMPESMRQIQRHNAAKCPTFTSTVFDKEHVEKTVPDWDALDKAIRRKVVLADIARYYLMWVHGGMYLDLDVRVNRDLNRVVKQCRARGKRVLLFTEHDRAARLGPRESHTHRIYNCMFWSEPGEDFWKECYDLAVARCRTLTTWGDPDILWASGPDVVTTVYHRSAHKDKIQVLDHNDSLRLLTHLEKGSWRQKKDYLGV